MTLNCLHSVFRNRKQLRVMVNTNRLLPENVNLFFQYSGPVAVCTFNVGFHVFIPHLLHLIIEIEIQFSLYKRPKFRVYISRGPTAHCVCSVASVLRRIFIRCRGKEIKVFFAGEEPRCALPFMGELHVAFHRFPNCEVSHCVIPFQGDTLRICIDRCF